MTIRKSKEKKKIIIITLTLLGIFIVLFGSQLLSLLDPTNIGSRVYEQTIIEMDDSGQKVFTQKLSTSINKDEEVGFVSVFYYEGDMGHPLAIKEDMFSNPSKSFIFQIPVEDGRKVCVKTYLSGIADDDETDRYDLFDFRGNEFDNLHQREDEYDVFGKHLTDGLYVYTPSGKSIYDYIGSHGEYFDEDNSPSKNLANLREFEEEILIWGRFYDDEGAHRGYGWNKYEPYQMYELCFNNNPLFPELKDTSCYKDWQGFESKTHVTCMETGGDSEEINEVEIEEDTEKESENIFVKLWAKFWEWFLNLFRR